MLPNLGREKDSIPPIREILPDEGETKTLILSLSGSANIYVDISTWPWRWGLGELTAERLATALSQLNRFQGNSNYSVAEHCVHGYSVTGDPWFLFHDAAEVCGFGDVNGLLKPLLGMERYREAEQHCLMAIAERFDVTITDIHNVDKALGNYEAYILNGHKEYLKAYLATAHHLRYAPALQQWKPQTSFKEWMKCFEQLKHK